MTTAATRVAHVHTRAPLEGVNPDELVQELTDSLGPRLEALIPSAELEGMVRSALDELAPVHITTYLGILVERRLRAIVNAG